MFMNSKIIEKDEMKTAYLECMVNSIIQEGSAKQLNKPTTDLVNTIFLVLKRFIITKKNLF